MNENILVTRKLYKKYGKSNVLDDVNITVKKGNIYGLVGRNGAGKTTLIRVALSLANITEGEIELFNKTTEKERILTHSRIGAMIETPSFFPGLTAKQNLEYYRIQRGIMEKESVDEALKLVGLDNLSKKKFKGFSLGMKQRLGLALALLGNPDFLILDEPINGLDPMGIKHIREILLELNKIKNVTILISSHILGELSQLATHYGFINDGKLIEEISSKELEERCKHCLSIKVDNVEKASIILEKDLNCEEYEVLNDGIIKVYKYLDEPYLVNSNLVKNDIKVYSLERTGSSLEDYFLELVGGNQNA
ncbi:ATP-binding cassette domain-containing protein [Clostridium chauvoei]|uniref:ATP-binding cassette domain-containing protein n=2 Tax=Clostridium chauvoei TaxID=46867 RepID=A0ABD4REN8_9CLOT|nr:ATP-binding cassette domain-containing protein [Clostridium chauvoei]ATD54412.1 bacitracin ABC transporter ATP-binding protein [Clostridium chauvoei]ATD57904.1 bacitracin ABC transporter ATP-binding protein [Clostridium chauvoei]MBX7279695.1 ATP-binding cassette domain-containing protein [Clostridium chauvoei]MBX7282064.1 ATP-binding cassette domain-containing protein [Clostridium chauvoei]MBX7284586.1 ATP-binding cassette domain-containing protein [Clostridium chauvoei]